ncbi:MAG: DUF2919 family protein, partial [bacterium]
FLMRPYVVLLVSVTNRSNRMEFIELVYPDRLWLAIDTVAALPAVILVAVTFFVTLTFWSLDPLNIV